MQRPEVDDIEDSDDDFDDDWAQPSTMNKTHEKLQATTSIQVRLQMDDFYIRMTSI